MRVAFLVGSGLSCAAGMPSVDDMTNVVLNEPWYAHTDNSFYPGLAESYSSRRTWVPQIRELLRMLEHESFKIDCESNRSCSEIEQLSYEDLFFICSQIEQGRRMADPVSTAFYLRVKDKISGIENGVIEEGKGLIGIHDIIDETLKFINRVVQEKLSTVVAEKELDKLDSLFNCICKTGYDPPFVFSLNHDLLLECIFKKNGISFVDGFGPEQYFGNIEGKQVAIRKWNPDLLEKSANQLRLLKLHGSIDWEYNQDGNFVSVANREINSPTERIAEPIEGFITSEYPLLLTGKYNKEIAYTNWIFGDLFYLFRKYLRTVDKLIVIGYGFADRGINNQVSQWMGRDDSKQMIVIDPTPENTFVFRNSNFWAELKGRTKFITKYIEKLTERDLAEIYEQ